MELVPDWKYRLDVREEPCDGRFLEVGRGPDCEVTCVDHVFYQDHTVRQHTIRQIATWTAIRKCTLDRRATLITTTPLCVNESLQPQDVNGTPRLAGAVCGMLHKPSLTG